VNFIMITSSRIQIAVFLLVLLAIRGAELVAPAQSFRPGSAFLWGLNIELFGAFNALLTKFWGWLPPGYPVTVAALAAAAALALAATAMMPAAESRTASRLIMAGAIDRSRGVLLGRLLAGTLAAWLLRHADHLRHEALRRRG
jgi:hypothetical protein